METNSPDPPSPKDEWKPGLGFKLATTALAPFVAMVVQAIPSNHGHDGFWTTWGDILALTWLGRDRSAERKAREVREGVSPEDDRP